MHARVGPKGNAITHYGLAKRDGRKSVDQARRKRLSPLAGAAAGERHAPATAGVPRLKLDSLKAPRAAAADVDSTRYDKFGNRKMSH